MNAMRTATATDRNSAVLVREHEFLRRRVLRALGDRERYRYVVPAVDITEDGLIVRSPCCSRNVDPEGGVIEIARIDRLGTSWLLYARDHKLAMWILHDEYRELDRLLTELNADRERVFWP